MELFFDLIFVAAVAQVGAALSKDYSWQGLLRYAFLFVLIWSAWTDLQARHSEGVSDRFLVAKVWERNKNSIDRVSMSTE